MASDITDVLGQAIGKVAREAAKSVSSSSSKSHGSHGNITERVSDAVSGRMKNVSGSKGLAAGVGIATVVPLAAKGVGKLARGIGGNGGGGDDDGDGLVKKAGKQFGEGAKDAVMPGGGGKSKGMPGVGKGRRMPVQQDIDIGVPIDMAYKHWVQYEEWPKFMHRLDNVSQEDDEHLSFKTKIWGISKEFKAEIVEHEPRERIKWQVTDGVTHTGVVTFHELGPRLTRVEVNIDVQPGSLIEKAARGMRHVKRAVRADLARFKAYVLMQEQEDSGGDRSSAEETSQRATSSARKSSSSGGGRSGRKQASGRKQSSSRSSSNGSSGGSSSSSSRSSSSRTRASSSNGRSSSSSRGRKASSNGRSSSSRTRASSNGGSAGSSRKRASSRS